MNNIIQYKVLMDCIPCEYREIRTAFLVEAPDWCETVGAVEFPENELFFRFDAWETAAPLQDGSAEKLSRMFSTVVFRWFVRTKGAPEPETPTCVWCAGKNVTELSREEIAGLKDRTFLEDCRRFLRYEKTAGEGFAHKVQLSGEEDRSAVSWGENRFGECEVYYWDSLKALGCGDFHTVGNRSDGRTVATGSNANGQCNVEEFRNADTLACGRYHTAALKKVGSVLLASDDERFTQCSTWRGIVGLRSVGDTLIGVKRDGTVVIDGDPLCPCSRDEIKELFPEMKLVFPAGFRTLAAKITSEDKRKERKESGVKPRGPRKAPASAVELDEEGRIPDRSKKPRPIRLEEPETTVSFELKEMLDALEKEFCGAEPVLPYYAPDAAKYLEKNGIPPVGDNCKRVSEEELRHQIREFFMVCRLCTNKTFAKKLAESAARSASGKLIKNRSQRIATFRLTHGEDFYELCARNTDAAAMEIGIVPIPCTMKNCRGLTVQPDCRAVLAENCSVQLD